MKKYMIALLASIVSISHMSGESRLNVNDINVPQGGKAALEIKCDFDKEYTAFELEFSLAEGLSLIVDNEDGKPIVEKCFGTDHALSGSRLSNGNYKFTCYSLENVSLPSYGALMRVTVMAEESTSVGASLACSIVAVEFTRTSDLEGEKLQNAYFGVSIEDKYTVLDENSTEMPVAEENARVRVKRAIAANTLSTICLPFAMTEAQTKEAFGEGVQLSDFTGWSSDEDEEGNIVSLNLYQESVSAMEANHPYIITVVEDVTEFTVDGVNIEPEEEPTVQVGKKKAERGYLIGSYTVSLVPEDGLFINDGKFCYSDGQSEMKAFRAYFELADVLSDTEGDVAVSFRGVQTAKDNKNNIYDLQGRKMASDKVQKGVYIVNGEKVLK